ncbi:MAG: helix-turn-helix domain-containing protein [Candidatus Aminicenantes bacterium]|nr:MAG: helix-turn-helix domain-containing protein [Candidatus Aminicenantes bacterium]
MAALGQKLREEREARNISIEEIASATKIVPRYLEALEADHLDQMPGGFFVKGIIRSYAHAIGLDADEVLARYKAAGLVGGRAARSAPAEQVPQYVPTVPIEPESPAEAAPAPAPAHEAVTDLFVEEAPKAGLSPAARKRIFAWGWRTLAALVVIAAVFYLWSSRRPRPPQQPPETVVARETLPPAQKTEPGPAPVSQSQTENPSEPPPVVEEVWRGVTIEISFQAETWIQIRTDGEIKVDGLFPAGATARAQADKELLIHTGNAGGFSFRLNGRPAKPLGRSGQVLTDIKIRPDNLSEFLDGPASVPSAR